MDRKKITELLIRRIEPSAKRTRIWDNQIPGFHVVVAISGNITFYFRYRLRDRQKDFRLGQHGAITARQARLLALSAAGDVAKGIDIQDRKKKEKLDERRRRQSTLDAFIEQVHEPFLLTERKTGKQVLAQLKTSFGHWYHLPMCEITEWRVKRWRQDKIKQGLKNPSINRPVTYLRAVLNHAFRLEVIDRHPLQHLKKLKEDRQGRVRYLTPNEEKHLREALIARDRRFRDARIRYNRWLSERGHPQIPCPPFNGYFDYLTPLIILAINTGLRRGELLSLCWHHYDRHSRTITVMGMNAKSQNTRHVPLNQEATKVLEQWYRQSADSEFIFVNPKTGEQLTDIKRAWENLLVDGNITDFRFHDLRHHFASSLVMVGVDLNTVRDLLGHSGIDMTLRYAHLSPSHRASAVAMLDKHNAQNPK